MPGNAPTTAVKEKSDATGHPLRVRVLLPGGMTEPFWYDLGDPGPEQAVIGSIVQVPLMSKTVAGVVVETGRPSLEFRTKGVKAFAPGNAKVPRAWIELIQWIAAYYFTPLPQVFATCLPKAALDHLFAPKKARAASKAAKSKAADAEEARAAAAARHLQPNVEQSAAIAAVAECLSPFRFQSHLLHG